MNIDAAKQLFEEIVELCYQSGNPKLIEIVDVIFSEVDQATELSEITNSLEELQITINEIDALPEEEEYIQELQEKIESMLE
jgi:hypothetical protein